MRGRPVLRSSEPAVTTLQDVERAVEVNLDVGPVRLRHGHLVPAALEVAGDIAGPAAADRLDRSCLGLGRRVTG